MVDLLVVFCFQYDRLWICERESYLAKARSRSVVIFWHSNEHLSIAAAPKILNIVAGKPSSNRPLAKRRLCTSIFIDVRDHVESRRLLGMLEFIYQVLNGSIFQRYDSKLVAEYAQLDELHIPFSGH